jgi:hypothetical protein
MGLSDSVSSPTMTPCQSGLPIDCIPPVNMSDSERAPILTLYQCFLGMLNWLMISTRPDLMTVHSLLAIATTKPTQGHLDAICYVGRYIKATADYHGISFSSNANDSLESFLTFPLDDLIPNVLHPTTFTDADWGPQDASVPTLKNSCQVSLNETRSISGHLVFLSGGPLIWKSQKEKNAPVRVRVRRKSKPPMSVQKVFSGSGIFWKILICFLLVQRPFSMIIRQWSSGPTPPAPKACDIIMFGRMLYERPSMDMKKSPSNMLVAR